MADNKEKYFRTADLINKMAENGKINKQQAREEFNRVVDSLADLIKDESRDGVALYGLITFEVKQSKKREYDNVITGGRVVTPPKDYLDACLSPRIRKLKF